MSDLRSYGQPPSGSSSVKRPKTETVPTQQHVNVNATTSKEEAIRRADLDRDIAAAVARPGALKAEDRETFTVPHGCVPVQDGEGKATGGFVIAAIADKLPGYQPIYEDNGGPERGVLKAVRQTATPAAAFEKLNSALVEAIDQPLFQMDVPGYEPLRRVLEEAYNQSARGKGRQRHANEKPFLRQPIMEICRMVGIGGQTYQIIKKAQEATTLDSRGQRGAAKAELLGVIVYAAAAYLLIEENE